MENEERTIYTKLQEYITYIQLLFGPAILFTSAIFNLSNTTVYYLAGFLFILIVAQAILDFKIYNKFFKATLINIIILSVGMYIIVFHLQ